MARTIRGDDKLPEGAAEAIRTTAKETTADAASKAVADREKRRAFADWLKSGGLPGLIE
ncbi:type II toxin-antitoxin system VapB family antitoxin [Micromonospora sp. DT233]|uniref:type II toxin-antitoxin system VapB family antitoxin n=1 Tax=Micromonospora sp. DT233 TaxID=3393432 RepID=UPI003CF75623